MIARLKHALHRRRCTQRYAFLDELLRNQRLSPDELRAKQQRDLQAIIRHAVAHSPYYRNQYADAPRDRRGDYRIEDLPILRKAEVLAHRDEILSTAVDPARVKLGHTGGSTGTPLGYFYDDAKHERMRACVARSYTWTGWRPGQKVLNFWGAPQDLKGRGLRPRLDGFIGAVETIGAYAYTEADLVRWARRIQDWRPVIVQGYPSIIGELSRFMLESDVPAPPSVIAVYTTAEVLYDEQRARIGRAFGCKVYNQYGCREIPNVSVQCPEGAQHILSDMAHVETLEADGEERLILTALSERIFPFIRYEVGDTGRLQPGACPCGLPFPLMEVGQCRSNDLIRTPSGRKIHPSRLNRLLDGLTGIRQYQFVQHEIDRIRLSLVGTEPLREAVAAGLRERLRKVTHPQMELELHYPQQIERTRSGKHRFVICDLPEDRPVGENPQRVFPGSGGRGLNGR